MNEHLAERFQRSKGKARHRGGLSQEPLNPQAHVWILPPVINDRVRAYATRQLASGGAWLQRPATPTPAEVLDTDFEASQSASDVELPANVPIGAYTSKQEYLQTQYELLREDAVRPLRDAVTIVKSHPNLGEDELGSGVGLYDKVHICGITASTVGIATRVTFSLARVGKTVLWQQSKRLATGSIVALTPARDPFTTVTIVATIAARPLSGLQKSPPEVDLFISSDELELDPAIEWLMVETKTGYWEASKHILTALQMMASEEPPLFEHFVDVQQEIHPPQYLIEQPRVDMGTVFRFSSAAGSTAKIDIVNSWPNHISSDLDLSQLDALRRILTKRLAIVQGPPGCGKSYVSAQALKVMLANHSEDDPPIVVACHTNHALDQLLRHVAEFEKNFIRLGGQTKDEGVIKQRTLYEVSRDGEGQRSSSFDAARQRMRDLTKEIESLLKPLSPSNEPLDVGMLERLNIITQDQASSLQHGASRWITSGRAGIPETSSPFKLWLDDALISVPLRQSEETFFQTEEIDDLEVEQLEDQDAILKKDEEIERLKGLTFEVTDNFIARTTSSIPGNHVGNLMNTNNLWSITKGNRPVVYQHLQQELKLRLRALFREKARAYELQVRNRRIARWELEEVVIRKQKLVGLTTTGFSKYRAILHALQPKIVVIEEAAETMEAPIVATCVESLQHLILVGDHCQLRPHTNVRELEGEPFYLDVSLFERMIKNNLGYSMLAQQRRMNPEIRRLLWPIYGNAIQDHPSVLKRPDVPGMSINSFFFAHTEPEERDELFSCINRFEAQMIACFIEYLVLNGVRPEQITVLTFYNGQRKRLVGAVRQCLALSGRDAANKVKICTVDSYQGEENDIVCLSLVRSNTRGSLGFLDVANRVCVALSRARCGFYLFGNGETLCESEIFESVFGIMSGQMNEWDARPHHMSNRIDESLPITCKNHGQTTNITSLDDWEGLNGGCSQPCLGRLSCGHPCSLLCHPFSHDHVRCEQKACRPATPPPAPSPPPAKIISAAKNWQAMAKQEHQRSMQIMAGVLPAPRHVQARAAGHTPVPSGHHAIAAQEKDVRDSSTDAESDTTHANEAHQHNLIDLGHDEELSHGVEDLALAMDGTRSEASTATIKRGHTTSSTPQTWSPPASLLD